MATLADRAGKAFEDLYPHLTAIAIGAACYLNGQPFAAFVTQHQLKIDQAYTGIFGISTVLTGFLFTFYSFVLTTEHGFIGRARTSYFLRRTTVFTVTALVAGATAALASMILLVWQPRLAWTVGGIAFAFWAAIAVWSLLCFERACRLFMIFSTRQAR